jgi:hypothetical protein
MCNGCERWSMARGDGGAQALLLRRPQVALELIRGARWVVVARQHGLDSGGFSPGNG